MAKINCGLEMELGTSIAACKIWLWVGGALALSSGSCLDLIFQILQCQIGILSDPSQGPNFLNVFCCSRSSKEVLFSCHAQKSTVRTAILMECQRAPTKEAHRPRHPSGCLWLSQHEALPEMTLFHFVPSCLTRLCICRRVASWEFECSRLHNDGGWAPQKRRICKLRVPNTTSECKANSPQSPVGTKSFHRIPQDPTDP